MSIRDIDFMCAIVEDYIHRVKGEKVKIDRLSIANDIRQQQMLIHAFGIAKNGNK
jgi:hypothetical protein